MYKNPNRELRMVLTQKCNYKCTFCHGEGMQNIQQDKMNAQDYAFLFKVGKEYFGMDTTTLSGGEPLFRRDSIDIAKALYNEGADITVTTNGLLLKKRPEIGKYAQRINVSLHTLDEMTYGNIVQVQNTMDLVKSGMLGIRDAYPDSEIRLNAALVEGTNTDERQIIEYADYARDLGASIKYLELYPKECDNYFPLENAIDILERNGFERSGSATRKKNFVKNGVEIGLSRIFCSSAMDYENPAEYCYQNNDMFVNPEGTMKPCRSIPTEVDALPEIKTRDSEGLAAKIEEAFSLLGKGCPLTNGGNIQ